MSTRGSTRGEIFDAVRAGGDDGDPSPRIKGIAVLNTDVAANTTISTSTNATGTFLDYSGVTFSTEVEIHINGVLMRCGSTSGSDYDVYPAGSEEDGDFACEFDLKDTDVVQMFIGGGAIGGDGVTADGTTAQDAVLLAERADHVNTPGEGAAEVWVLNEANQRLRFTNDASVDFDLVRLPDGQDWTNTGITIGTSNRGQMATAENFRYSASLGQLRMYDANSNIRMKEGSAPTGFNTYGHWWVQTGTPNRAMFTDDASTVHHLTPHVGKTAAPGTSDNGAAGYQVGSVWVDETNDDAYISVDASTTAVWKRITP